MQRHPSSLEPGQWVDTKATQHHVYPTTARTASALQIQTINTAAAALHWKLEPHSTRHNSHPSHPIHFPKILILSHQQEKR